MARSLVALWLTLIAAIVTISFLALSWVLQREQNTRQRIGDVLTAQLMPVSDSISRVLDDYSIRLRRELAECDFGNLENCVQVTRSPLAHALVVVNADAQYCNLAVTKDSAVDHRQRRRLAMSIRSRSWAIRFRVKQIVAVVRRTVKIQDGLHGITGAA